MSTKSQVLGLQWIQRAARSVQEGATFGQILFFYLKQEVELKVLFKPQTALSVVVVCFLWTERDSNIWKRASHRSINEHNRTLYLTFQLETRNEGLCNKDTKDGTQTFSFFFLNLHKPLQRQKTLQTYLALHLYEKTDTYISFSGRAASQISVNYKYVK